jgi:hypothetical protein
MDEYDHALQTQRGVLRVRTFLTEGLASRGAKEVSATVPARWSEAQIGAISPLFVGLARFAEEENPAVLGGFTGFQSGDLGGGRKLGVTYARGTFVRGIPTGDATLAAVLLQEEEYRLAERGFATRVLGRLADRARYFPYPPWWEVRDAPALREREQAESFLSRCGPYAWLGDVRVTRVAGRDFEVSLPSTVAPALADLWREHPELESLTLGAALAPDADGQMLWYPGDTQPSATARGDHTPERMGHAFLTMVRSGDDTFRLIEDGLGLLLSPRLFDQARDALVTGQDVALPLGDGVTIRFQVRPRVIADPITGRELVAPGGWERYDPIGGPTPDMGRVSKGPITLLTPTDLLSQRVDTPVLARFIEDIHRAMEQVTKENPVGAPVPVAVRFVLTPGATPSMKLAYQGDAPARGSHAVGRGALGDGAGARARRGDLSARGHASTAPARQLTRRAAHRLTATPRRPWPAA